MDILPFVNKNGLWHLDMPELIEPNLTATNQLFIAERNFAELLDTLANKKLTQLKLEFHYDYINPYDAKLIRRGSSYICESIYYKEKNTLLWVPPILFRAMVGNSNPDTIYLRVTPMVTS